MAGEGKGIAAAAIGAGALLLFAAITGKDIPAALRDVITGKSPASAPVSEPITGEPIITSSAGSSSPIPAGGSGGGDPAANRALGRLLAAAYGWSTGDNWSFLSTGWEEESGWSTTAANDPADPYNHAYGIPQANPGTKMASAGANWKTSAYTQIRWGLDYIKGKYGSPSQVPLWSATGPLPGYQGY